MVELSFPKSLKENFTRDQLEKTLKQIAGEIDGLEDRLRLGSIPQEEFARGCEGLFDASVCIGIYLGHLRNQGDKAEGYDQSEIDVLNKIQGTVHSRLLRKITRGYNPFEKSDIVRVMKAERDEKYG